MAIQIILEIIIAALLGYIVFLHIHLSKKNIFIETTVKRLSGIEKSRSMEEMMDFLQEIQRLSQYRAFFTDNFFDSSTINFILSDENNLKIFMHYTKEEADAKSIIRDGFKFADSFYRTALPASKDTLDLRIKHNSRKFFGNYLIIICISNDIVNFYSLEIEKSGIKNITVENILTEASPIMNESADLVYQLVPQFIKGYINLRSGDIIKNPVFDPYFNSPDFMKNIKLLEIK
jgi:hypothetical protein